MSEYTEAPEFDEFDEEFLIEDPLLEPAVPRLRRAHTYVSRTEAQQISNITNREYLYSAEELFAAVDLNSNGGNPTIVYYWGPNATQQSPTVPLIEDYADIYDDINFVLVEGDFALPPMTSDDLPAVVLYIGSAEREYIPIDLMEGGLVGSRDLYHLIQVALNYMYRI